MKSRIRVVFEPNLPDDISFYNSRVDLVLKVIYGVSSLRLMFHTCLTGAGSIVEFL